MLKVVQWSDIPVVHKGQEVVLRLQLYLLHSHLHRSLYVLARSAVSEVKIEEYGLIFENEFHKQIVKNSLVLCVHES